MARPGSTAAGRAMMKRMAALGLVSLCGALLAAPALAQDWAVLSTNMFGEKVGEKRGKANSSADFNGEADFRKGRLCYYMEVFGLEGANGAAIHKAKDGEDGPQVLALTMPKDRYDEACVTADAALLREIAGAPGEYYVLVGHPDHPDGAIRGQLGD